MSRNHWIIIGVAVVVVGVGEMIAVAWWYQIPRYTPLRPGPTLVPPELATTSPLDSTGAQNLFDRWQDSINKATSSAGFPSAEQQAELLRRSQTSPTDTPEPSTQAKQNLLQRFNNQTESR
jgi:hypothetical protein